MAPNWNFEYTGDKMSAGDLSEYQNKLIELRDNYEKSFSELKECSFYSKNLPLPPPNNIFAKFGYVCKSKFHQPLSCQDWYLIWNPNIEKDISKLELKSKQYCAPTKYKILCKRIQSELQMRFFNFFRLFYMDSDVDYYKLSDSFHNLYESDEEKQRRHTEAYVQSIYQLTSDSSDNVTMKRRRCNSNAF